MLIVHMNSDATWAHTTIAKKTQQLITSGVDVCRLCWDSITFKVLRKEPLLCIVQLMRCSMHHNPELDLAYSTFYTESDMLHSVNTIGGNHIITGITSDLDR
jgi:hypothetical protein